MTEIKPGRVIAKGACGSVHELFLHGMKFACKILHEHLVPVEPGAKNVFYQKFHEEIDLLTKMRHPCIVQFVKVYYPQVGSPVLVMEFLPTTLRKAIENYKSLPDEIVFSIFEDIALGLCFLHGQEPVVIHRDLSSNNILLDDNMRAKIGDLGMAKLIDEGSQKRLMSRMPGTAVFMPPEARKVSPDYKTDIDIFSFGVLMVFVFSGKWPEEVYDYPEDPKLEYDKKWLTYIEKIRLNYHSVLGLVKQCLSRSADRPNATAILKGIRTEKAAVQVFHGSRMRMIQQREADKTELERLRNDREKVADISRLNAQVKTIEEEKETDQTEKESLRSEIQKLKILNNIKTDQIKTQDKLMETQRELLNQKEEELEIETSRLEQAKRELDMKESEKQRVQERCQTRKKQAEAERDEAWKQMSAGEQFHLLHPNTMLIWGTVHQKTSISMTAPQYTIIGSNLYFGGGHTDDDRNQDRNRIFKFDTNANDPDLEQSLETFGEDTNTDPIQTVEPHCPVIHFGLGNFGGKLVAVGGKDQQGFSNKVRVLEKNENGTLEWSENTIKACLSTPRARVCVVSETEDENSNCIAACGGRIIKEDSTQVSTNVVEVYRKDSPTWIKVTSLPVPGAALRATVLHNTAYLLGGWADANMKLASIDDCFAVNIDNLFSRDCQVSWKSLPKLPTRNAAPGHLCGTLLALGGIQTNDQTDSGRETGTTATRNLKPVFAFNSNTQEWVRIATLPKEISSATAASLPNGKLLFFGGWEKERVDTKRARNADIFIAKLTGRMFTLNNI